MNTTTEMRSEIPEAGSRGRSDFCHARACPDGCRVDACAAGDRQVANRDLKGGFTLLELLITVAIIATLLALMVPVIGRMWESANEARCVSNLKRLSAGVLLYCADHDGYFPDSTVYYSTNATGDVRRTSGLWFSCLIGKPDYGVTEYVKWSWRGAYHCPSDTYIGKPDTSYAMNAYLIPPAYTGGTSANKYTYSVNLGVRLSDVKPGIAMLKDSNDAQRISAGGTESALVNWKYTYAVHRGGQNVSFVDGRVQWVNVSPHPPGNSTDCVDMKQSWFTPVR